MPCYIIVYQRPKVIFNTCIIPIIFVSVMYIRLSDLRKPKIKTVHSKKMSTISSNFLDDILYRKMHYPCPKRLCFMRVWVLYGSQLMPGKKKNYLGSLINR